MHLFKPNQPAAVVVTEKHDRHLQQQPFTPGRSKAEIDAVLAEERNG